MKNASLPAYPQSFSKVGNDECGTIINFLSEDEIKQACGLTKREMFAMNAPSVTPSFAVSFAERNKDDKSIVEIFKHDKAYKLTMLGDMQLLKSWSYAYADMMLREY